MIRFRKIVEDYETRLSPGDAAEGAGATGKAEWEAFDDGDIEFELSVRGLDVVGPEQLDVRLNAGAIGTVEIVRGRGGFRLRLSDGQVPPTVKAGDVVTIERGGVVLAKGIFDSD